MPTFNKPLRFSTQLWLTTVTFVIFALVFAIYVRSERAIDRANELRLTAHLLADELRQSTNQLSRMARSYVITGDPIYKRHYQEILDIREGRTRRPKNYHLIDWDLIFGENARPNADDGQSLPWLDLIRQAELTEQELAKLSEAKASSDALTRSDYAAMALIESTAPPTESNRITASLMLRNDAYDQASARVMRPIGEFYRLMGHRTLEDVRNAENTAMALRVLIIGLGLLMTFLLWHNYRSLASILGASVDDLRDQIIRLGSGNFSQAIAIRPETENTVMAWLSKTQHQLAALAAEHEKIQAQNKRLARLYATLSQCNEAIVRADSKEALFPKICLSAVEHGGMKLAWIGLIDENTQRIRPVANYGADAEYLKNIDISIDKNDPSGQGPTGIAIREDRPFWCQDFQKDTATLPWRARGEEFGWQASAALPLHQDGKVIGALNLYASEANAFDETARKLLVEMTMDIDYALNNFQRERQRNQARQALQHSESNLRRAQSVAKIGSWRLDLLQGGLEWSEQTYQIFGLPPDSPLNYQTFLDCIHPEDREYVNAAWLAAKDGEPYHIEHRIVVNGEPRWVEERAELEFDANGDLIAGVGTVQDITERKQIQARIERLANFDPLTGLPNRAQLDDRIRYALSLAKRSNGQLALIFLDLDRFKDINDTLGHSVGDALLIELASRLRGTLREEDTVTRMGGDEFILLLPGTDGHGVAVVAEKLLSVISEPYRIGHYDLSLTASMGIALYPSDGMDLETLSRNADAAMYRAKQEGRQGYRFFTPEMQARSARNLELLTALRHAQNLGQLEIFYQPQVSIADQKIVGAEALLRWTHPELGMISPGEFIPIAEDSGLILSIGEWVLRSAVRQTKIWHEKGLTDLAIAINLSAMQFRHPDLPDLISTILDEAGLPPRFLELELTEGMAMHDAEGAIEVIDKLHQRGIRMAIDDFGTGYSSLNYLKKFKVYKLKIDQSFVRDISTDHEDRAIVNAVISLAKSLGLMTIAEGVETEAQRAFLQEKGCDEMQGYWFSKPLPAEQFETLLRSRL